MDKAQITNDEEKKIDIQAVLSQFSVEELKFQACQNHLIGNFDKEKKYHILEIILPELANLDKLVVEKLPNRYTAYSRVVQNKIWFAVDFAKQDDGKMQATLVLEEKFVIGQIYEATLQTPISTFVDDDAPDFASKMRKHFHLFLSDDPDEKSLWEDYVSPPIELATELIRKADLLSALSSGREKRVADYMNEMLKALKQTPEGTSLAKLFFIEIRQSPIKDVEQNRTETFKAVLDKLIDAEIATGNLTPKQVEAIAKVRQDFLEETKKNTVEFLENKSKIFAPEKTQPAPEKKSVEKPKESFSSTAPSAKGVDLPKSSSGKFFENSASTNVSFPGSVQAKEKRRLSPKTTKQTPQKTANPMPRLRPTKKESLNADILSRAKGTDKTAGAFTPPPQPENESIFAEGIKVSISHTYDLGDITITVSEEITKTTKSKEQEMEL